MSDQDTSGESANGGPMMNDELERLASVDVLYVQLVGGPFDGMSYAEWASDEVRQAKKEGRSMEVRVAILKLAHDEVDEVMRGLHARRLGLVSAPRTVTTVPADPEARPSMEREVDDA